MARPKLDRPNYKLAERGGRFHVEWWAEGRSHRVPCGTTSRAEAEAFLAQFIAGASTPAAPAATTISVILDGYLADRKERVAAYDTLEAAVAALQRHLGGLLPEHVTKEVARLYRRQRHAEGYQVGPPDARRTKPVKDGTVIRELVTLRAAIRWAVSAKWIPADACARHAGDAAGRGLDGRRPQRLSAQRRVPHVLAADAPVRPVDQGRGRDRRCRADGGRQWPLNSNRDFRLLAGGAWG